MLSNIVINFVLLILLIDAAYLRIDRRLCCVCQARPVTKIFSDLVTMCCKLVDVGVLRRAN